MKKLTKVLPIVLATTLMTVPVMASTITLNINGSVVTTTVAPYQSNGTTLVPLRVVSENLGAKVDWNQQTKTVTITQDATTINLTLGSKIAKVNGEEKTLNLAPQIKNNTTMVPIRFVSENLNCDVNWNKETQTVSVTGKAKTETVASEEGTFIIKNPVIFADQPSLSVQWLEDNLGTYVKYYPQYNRYVVIDETTGKDVTISEKNRWIRISSAKVPYLGDYDCGKDKSTAIMSADIVAKAFGYEWTYDKATKVLKLTKVEDEPIKFQEAVNGYVTVKGYVKHLETQEPVANAPIIIYVRKPNNAFEGIYETTTDANGYYEYKVLVSTLSAGKDERVEVQCRTDKFSGSSISINATRDNIDGEHPYLYWETIPTIYVKNK